MRILQRRGSTASLIKVRPVKDETRSLKKNKPDLVQHTKETHNDEKQATEVTKFEKPEATPEPQDKPTLQTPKNFGQANGIPTVDILRLSTENSTTFEEENGLKDSGAWSFARKNSSREADDIVEDSSDDLMRSYLNVVSQQMAFESRDEKQTGREDHDLNLMSVDFDAGEVFEV